MVGRAGAGRARWALGMGEEEGFGRSLIWWESTTPHAKMSGHTYAAVSAQRDSDERLDVEKPQAVSVGWALEW